AAPAVGAWSAADVAIPLAHGYRVPPALAAGEMDSPLADLGQRGALSAWMVEAERGAGLDEVASRIEESAARFLRLLRTAPGPGDDGGAPWLLRGVTAPRSTFACHLISESLIHGDDIARSQRRRWS